MPTNARAKKRLGRPGTTRHAANRRIVFSVAPAGAPNSTPCCAAGQYLHYNERGKKVFLADSARDGEIARLLSVVRAACAGVPSAQQETATRAAAAQATRMRFCALARERIRALEHGGSQIPAWMIEEARTRATCICASPKK